MNWIDSAGGPLILMERAALAFWGGCFSGGGSDFESDYERACAVDAYAGVIQVEGRSALVLGDEPCETTVWRVAQGNDVIVRWQCRASTTDGATFYAGATVQRLVSPCVGGYDTRFPHTELRRAGAGRDLLPDGRVSSRRNSPV